MQLPVAAIPNAVDLQRFVPGNQANARSRLSLNTDAFVVLMLANLAPQKGQAILIRAVEMLVRKEMPIECWLVGEDRSDGGAYERELRQLCRERGVATQVRFLGYRTEVPDLLQAADVFALPSTHEGLPISILEAQSAGVPVVGSRIPGIREVVEDGVTGLLVEPEDPEGFADSLERLASDAHLKQRLVDNAAAQVRREFGWDTFEDRVFATYRRLQTSKVSLPDVTQF
jgi:glycosyltransferase involved in cell wall biosynthesis